MRVLLGWLTALFEVATLSIGDHMKRALSQFLPFLLTGAFLNLAVAWAISAFVVAAADLPTRNAIQTPRGERIPYLLWREPGIEFIKWDLELDDGGPTPSTLQPPPAWSSVAARPAFNAPDAEFVAKERCEAAAGWPMRSMRWCYVVKDPPNIRILEPRYAALWLPNHPSMPSWHVGRRRAIPLLPIWTGFAVNTAFYSIFACVAVGIPNLLQRRLRRRRSLCEACAYPIGSSPVCTECGHPVRPRISQPSTP